MSCCGFIPGIIFNLYGARIALGYSIVFFTLGTVLLAARQLPDALEAPRTLLDTPLSHGEWLVEARAVGTAEGGPVSAASSPPPAAPLSRASRSR